MTITGREVSDDLFARIRATYTAIARELHDLVEHEHVATPFLFVGHSLGGALARVYYAMYPKDVRAIVFIDPMNETYNKNDPDREKNMALQEQSLTNAPAGVL